METVRILDEQDEVCDAVLFLRSGRVWAEKTDGVIIFPGCFLVLSAAEEEMLVRADERMSS